MATAQQSLLSDRARYDHETQLLLEEMDSLRLELSRGVLMEACNFRCAVAALT
jgi:hypothetical protein